jgi:hypothetical protein
MKVAQAQAVMMVRYFCKINLYIFILESDGGNKQHHHHKHVGNSQNIMANG